MRLLIKPIYLAAFLMFVAVAFFTDNVFAKGNTIIWQGTVPVKKTYHVPKGKTLEIRPGTRVLFSKGCSLKVSGTIRAVGRKGEEILFSSAQKGSNGSWHEIMIDSAGESVFEHCIIDNATWGLHSHDTKLNLTACTIRNSEVGFRFRSGPVIISKCLFTGNKIGIRSYQGIAQISESDFTDNEIGIFVREKGSGLNISRSNLFRNSAYNIRIGDFNNEDVKASDNWWGNDNPSTTIFDARNEPDIGIVLFEPFSKERISWQ